MPSFRDPAMLLDHVATTMAFYHPRCIDSSGGFYHFFKDDGTVYDASTRHLVSSARFVFNYAQAFRHFHDPAYLQAVRHGVAFLRDAHRDPVTGGYCWELCWQDGRATPRDATNHCYGLAFVLLAYAHAFAAGMPEARAYIDETFDLLEERFWEAQYGLYADQASADWAIRDPYRGQNANMHCCEALLAAFEATGDKRFLHRAETLAHNITVRQADLTDGLIWEHYHADWTVDRDYNRDDPKNLFRPWSFQPGHFTEWAKLLLNLERHGAALHGSPDWLLPRAQALFAAALPAWDDTYGGLAYGLNPGATICDDDKYFWVQAESIAAAAILAVRTGDAQYWDWYDRLWDYSWRQFVDHEYGAWYRILARDNSKLTDEKSPAGKTDYHTMGACYEVVKVLDGAARPWLATFRAGGIPATVDPDAWPSVVHLMEAAMDRFADKIAFRAGGASLSYRDVDHQSRAFASWLQHTLYIQPGDRVALMLPNVLAFPVASLGILRAGAVQVNVNPMYTARELEHQLNDAGVTVIVACQLAVPALEQVRSTTGIQHVLIADDPDTGLAAAVCAGAALPFTPVTLRGDDALFLQYTGGTSGLSKGAVLTHRNLIANIAQFKAISPDALRAGEEVIVTAIPLYHIFALMVNFLAYFSVGAENWLVPNPRDLPAFIDVLKQARASVFVGVNTLYASLLAHPRIGAVDFSRLRLSIGGGAAVVRVVSDQWQRVTGTYIREGYGLTETSPVLTFNPASVHTFTGTAGLPVPGTDIRLIDDAGAAVAIGQAGEICAKGPQVMAGYWQQPDASHQAFTPDGYFRTGDVGVFDAQGFLSIVDRKKDIVLVSGFNVYPNEVEAVASSCPGVAECACAGMTDAKSGEALVLFIVPRPGATLDAATVIAHCRTLLTAYKVPKDIRFVAALPKSTVGKILRRELRQMA